MGLEERVAASMREAYGKFCGDDIVPWDKAAPEKKRAWRCCARAAIGILQDTTPRASERRRHRTQPAWTIAFTDFQKAGYMAGRGRPAVTRARVMNYWQEHGPCSIMQVCRATGADRRHVQRMFRAAEKAGMVAV